MSYNFYRRFPTVNFTVRNVSPQRKTINIFGISIPYNRSVNLMGLPEISEAEIKVSLTKGELANKIRANDIVVVSSTLNLVELDSSFRSFIQSANENPSTPVPGTDPADVGGGGSNIIEDGGTLSGTYYGDVICKGDVELSGHVTIHGNLFVEGDLNNFNRYELVVKGDLHAKEIYFVSNNTSLAQSNFTVDGNFFFTRLEFPQTGGSPALLRVGGNLTGITGYSGSYLYGYGENNNFGLNVVVYGDLNVSNVYLYGGDSNSADAGGGSELIVYGDANIAYELNVSGGEGDGYNAGNGGFVEVYGNFTMGNDSYEVRFDGGYANNGNAGNGGTLEVHGNCVLTNGDGDVLFEGGDCYSDNAYHRSGSGGNIYIYGNLQCDSDLELGGGYRNGNLSEASNLEPPYGGSLYVTGNATVDEIDVDGGSIYVNNYSIGAAGNAGQITVQGSLVIREEIFANGGYSSLGSGGSGGNVSVYGDLVVNYEVELTGSSTSNPNSNAGSGGSLYVNGNCTIGDYLNTYGGDSSYGNAGGGGNINVTGKLSVLGGSINCYGGNCGSDYVYNYAGSGGQIEAAGIYAQGIYMDSGERSGATTQSYPALDIANTYPGSINCYGDLICPNIYGEGCHVSTTFPNVAGSSGSNIYVKGNLISEWIQIPGGNSYGNSAGNGGTLQVSGHTKAYQINSSGGSSENSGGVGSDARANGNGGTMYFFGGSIMVNLYLQDGSGAGSVPEGGTPVYLSGANFITNIYMPNRAGAQIRPEFSNQSTLKISTMTGKVTLNQLNGSQSSDISGSLANTLFMSNGSTWYAVTGTTIFP